MIVLANEHTLVLGISDEMEPCTYIFQEKDYSAVEGIMIITTFFKFNIIFEATVLHMPKLKSVGIQGAEAVSIFQSIYNKLGSIFAIEEIYIDGTGMTKPPDFIWEARQLSKLEFRHEVIPEIPNQLFELENLRSLTFAYCVNITTVPDNIKKLVNLVVFNLWQASIDYLSHELFLLPNINSIKFTYSSYIPTIAVRKALEDYKEKKNGCFYSWGSDSEAFWW